MKEFEINLEQLSPDVTLIHIAGWLDAHTFEYMEQTINNLFDEFYETGVVATPLFNQILTDDDGGLVHSRSFYTYVGAPRSVGIRFNYHFG